MSTELTVTSIRRRAAAAVRGLRARLQRQETARLSLLNRQICGNRFHTAMHWVFSATWVYVTAVFGVAFWNNFRGV